MKAWVLGLALSLATATYAEERVIAKDLKPIQYETSDNHEQVSRKLAGFCKANQDFEAAALLTRNGVVDVGDFQYKLVNEGKTTRTAVVIDIGNILYHAAAGPVTVYHCHVAYEGEFLYPSHYDVMNASMLLRRAALLDIPLSNIKFRVVVEAEDKIEGVEYWPSGLFDLDVTSPAEPLRDKEIDLLGQSLREMLFGYSNAQSFLKAADEFDSKEKPAIGFRKRLEDRLGPLSDTEAFFAYLSAASTFQYRTFSFPKAFNSSNPK